MSKNLKIPICYLFVVITDQLKKIEAKIQNSTCTTFWAILLLLLYIWYMFDICFVCHFWDLIMVLVYVMFYFCVRISLDMHMQDVWWPVSQVEYCFSQINKPLGFSSAHCHLRWHVVGFRVWGSVLMSAAIWGYISYLHNYWHCYHSTATCKCYEGISTLLSVPTIKCLVLLFPHPHALQNQGSHEDFWPMCLNVLKIQNALKCDHLSFTSISNTVSWYCFN